jgi:transposase InsO family protein
MLTAGPDAVSCRDNGMEFRAKRFRRAIAVHGVQISRIPAGRPQTKGAAETLHKTILDECWRLAFAPYLQVRFEGPSPRARPLPALPQPRPRPHRPAHPRPHSRRNRLPCAQSDPQVSRTCRHISESVHPRPRRFGMSPPLAQATRRPWP